MLVTYKGTSTALHVEVDGKAFRLTPSQPVEISEKQVDALKQRTIIKILQDAGEIEFGEDEVEADANAKADAEKPTTKAKK